MDPRIRTFTFDKTKLIATLKENRKEFVEIYVESLTEFRDQAIKVMRRHLMEAQDGGRIKLRVDLSPPDDYTKEYDAAIAIYEMCREEQIELTQSEFNRLVLNRWEWMDGAVAKMSHFSERTHTLMK